MVMGKNIEILNVGHPRGVWWHSKKLEIAVSNNHRGLGLLEGIG